MQKLVILVMLFYGTFARAMQDGRQPDGAQTRRILSAVLRSGHPRQQVYAIMDTLQARRDPAYVALAERAQDISVAQIAQLECAYVIAVLEQLGLQERIRLRERNQLLVSQRTRCRSLTKIGILVTYLSIGVTFMALLYYPCKGRAFA